MRLVGHGHAAIRATHHKTLELSRDQEITERATCVIGVGVSDDVAPMAGDVRITIRAGDDAFAFEARANPNWDPTGTAVIRRSPFRLADTLATHAAAAASDLPRALVEAMRDEKADVELVVEPIRGRRCVVLFALDPALPRDPRLATERAAADRVVAEDADAARALGVRVASGPVGVDGRVLVVASRGLPGATVVDALSNTDVETVGLPPPLAAAAASPSLAMLLMTDEAPRDAIRTAPAATRLVLHTAADQVDAVLALAAAQRGSAGAVLVQPNAPPLRGYAGTPVELPSRDEVYLCLDPAPDPAALDPRARAAIDALLADGVPTKAAANALAEFTGMPRRRAYALLLDWRQR